MNTADHTAWGDKQDAAERRASITSSPEYTAGYDAFCARLPEASCPHQKNTTPAYCWSEGYWAAHEDNLRYRERRDPFMVS